jgi:TPR repeat protein
LQWFRKAADQDNPYAQYYLGVSYAEGIGVAADTVVARNWLAMSAQQGLPEAQNYLASSNLDDGAMLQPQ